MTVQDRIELTKGQFGITNKKIAERAGLKKETVDKQLQGLYAVHISVLIAIAELAPFADMRWILTGEHESHDDLVLRVEKLEILAKELSNELKSLKLS